MKETAKKLPAALLGTALALTAIPSVAAAEVNEDECRFSTTISFRHSGTPVDKVRLNWNDDAFIQTKFTR